MVVGDMLCGGHHIISFVSIMGCVYVHKASAVSPTVSDTIIMVE
jgi:hypothetical protein